MPAYSFALQRNNLDNLAMLAGVFERVERSGTSVDAQQYLVLVDRLKQALAADLPTQGLNAVLAAHPAVAELYENLHYAQAGLCRSPLEVAVAAESAARELLKRLASTSRA